jgi:hypothetical protein
MHDTTGKAPPELIAFTQLLNPYQLDADSSYQNTCEFIAALTGLLLLHHFARHNFTYLLIGDSITATAETTSYGGHLSPFRWSTSTSGQQYVKRNLSLVKKTRCTTIYRAYHAQARSTSTSPNFLTWNNINACATSFLLPTQSCLSRPRKNAWHT